MTLPAPKRWLGLRRERVFGIAKRVKASGAPDDLYANLSTDSHGDPAPVQRLIGPDGKIALAPTRGNATRATLLMHAGFARDQAVSIAAGAGITVEGIAELDQAIQAGWERLNEGAGSSQEPQTERSD
jgi:hypothetical protein